MSIHVSVGQRVYWDDPDRGEFSISQMCTVVSVNGTDDDSIASLVDDFGGVHEVFLSELCSWCVVVGMKPNHNGSARCESGSIASGGKNSHCACDTCF